jgi:molybdopterin/thiamine biosynthesis adenylyltransferase
MVGKNVLRISSALFNHFVRQVEATDKECFAFLLAIPTRGQTKTIYMVRQLLLPDQDDLMVQNQIAVKPTPFFQGVAHLVTCMHSNVALIDFHTHPENGPVAFSEIDDRGANTDANVATEYLPPKATTGSVVFDHALEHFQGRIFNKKQKVFEPIDALEILGSPTRILTTDKPVTSHDGTMYHRQTLIPWFKQDRLADLNVAIIGLGGMGSMVLQGLLNCGISERGFILAVDSDELEISNVSRIPYASPRDIGKSKVRLARRYARFRRFKGKFHIRQTGIQDTRIYRKLKEAHLLVGTLDNDGGRRVLDELAVRYNIPLVDFGSEIFVQNDGHTDSGGQVRIVLPGQTGCLVCSGGINMAQAAWDLMSDYRKQEYEKAGYVRGTNQSPAPAVQSLNGIVSYLGISQILKMIFQSIDGQTSAFYQLENNQLFVADGKPNPKCPICGEGGILAAGDSVKTRPHRIILPNVRIIRSMDSAPCDNNEKVMQKMSHDGGG